VLRPDGKARVTLRLAPLPIGTAYTAVLRHGAAPSSRKLRLIGTGHTTTLHLVLTLTARRQLLRHGTLKLVLDVRVAGSDQRLRVTVRLHAPRRR
jgi:hypothetical protein